MILVELSTIERCDDINRRLSGISVDHGGLWLSKVPRSTDRSEVCCCIPVDLESQETSRILRKRKDVHTLVTFDDTVSPCSKVKVLPSRRYD